MGVANAAPGWFFLGAESKKVVASIPPGKVFFNFFSLLCSKCHFAETYY